MANPYRIPLWKHAPFLRLLIPFITGIIIQEYIGIPIFTALTFSSITFTCFLAFRFLPLVLRYRFSPAQGILLNMILLFAGMIVTAKKDIRNDSRWFGKYYSDSSIVIAKITEPLTEKERSFKTEATVLRVISNGSVRNTTGKILIYFSKKAGITLPCYGDEIMISGGLQPIRNSGNPGAFDYEKYMRFQGVMYQTFLKEGNYTVLQENKSNALYRFIYAAQKKVVSTLQRFIQGDKKVTGIAEALLIGYKENLDADTVQAYSNTGVVHIIAISGMHLGLIYIVLVWLFSKLPGIKKSKILKVILILSCLWLFSLITGASASVLRSAVMFTCIVIGKEFFRKASIYNSLSASAFILLVYDPYLLWDVGFQLSYAALSGIVWLQKPMEKIFYSRYQWLRKLWSLSAVTFSAQVFTLPVCIYYFHQIPTVFLISNLICVPLSTMILFAEIMLLSVSFFGPAAVLTGKCIYQLTRLMNFIVDLCNRIPYSVIDNVHATLMTTVLLYGFVFSFAFSVLRKSKQMLKISVLFIAAFMLTWGYGIIKRSSQKKIIIYNVSRHRAIDFISGDKFVFEGDADFLSESALKNFHLKPARIFYRAIHQTDSLPGLLHRGLFWQFGKKKMMIADTAMLFQPLQQKIKIDILLIQNNPKSTIAELTSAVSPDIIVFDASNSLWKIEKWKKECEQLNLRFHTAGKDGAFVTDAE